jgi:hypothetical protein
VVVAAAVVVPPVVVVPAVVAAAVVAGADAGQLQVTAAAKLQYPAVTSNKVFAGQLT